MSVILIREPRACRLPASRGCWTETYSSHDVLNEDLGGFEMQDPGDALRKTRCAVTSGAIKHTGQQGARSRTEGKVWMDVYGRYEPYQDSQLRKDAIEGSAGARGNRQNDPFVFLDKAHLEGCDINLLDS